MTEHELDVELFKSFLLGMRVLFQAHDIYIPGTESEKPYELLRQVAEGNLTLTDPGKLTAKYPQMAMYLAKRANRLISADQKLAKRILDGMNNNL